MSRGEGRPPGAPARAIWELELLISGAVIFSLFQLPAWLSDLYFGAAHHLSDRLFVLPFVVYYGAMLCVLMLIAGFGLHFLARGFWVALCGLNSVFPGGILWERLDVGPIQREYYERHTPSARRLEERVDRFASTIFSILFYMLFTLGVLSVYLMVGAVLIGGLARWVSPNLPPLPVFYAVLLGFLAPVMVVGAFDAWYKKRPEALAGRPRLRRALLRLLGFWQRYVLLQPLYGAIPLTFQTHFSTRRATAAFVAGSFLFATAFLVVLVVRGGLLGYDSYQFFPEEGGTLAVQADHYESMRGEGSRARVPTIQSDVVEGPYLRLFVPYRPDADRRLVEHTCPALEPLRPEGLFVQPILERSQREAGEAALEPVLACFAEVWRVHLDGEAVTPEWRFHRHPRRGTVGLLAHLPLRGLDPGRHELLVVKGTPEAGEADAEDEGREPRRYAIPFWI